jgi:DNA-binding NarL/FixJ family response regulator
VNVLSFPSPSFVRRRPAALVVVADPGAPGQDALESLVTAGFAATTVAPSDEAGDGAAPGVLVVLAGGSATQRLTAIAEAAGRWPGVPLVASMPARATGTQLRKALRAGAAGIVMDDDLPRTLGPTAQAVHAGQLAIPPLLGRRVAPQPLSYREKEVLGFVVRGYTNRQIADELYLAESTVKTHLSSAFAKLDTRSRAEAAALILDPEEGHGLGILPAAAPATAYGMEDRAADGR